MRTSNLLLILGLILATNGGSEVIANTNFSSWYIIYSPTNTGGTNILREIEPWVVNSIEDGPEDPNVDFWKAYGDIIEFRGDRITEEHLGRIADLRMTMNNLNMGYEWHEYYNDNGRSIFTDILTDSSREVMLARFPIKALKDDGTMFFKNVALSIFRGSVGNIDEERTDYVSSRPDSLSLDEKWWKTIHGNGLIDYGVRPFRESPYIYGTFGLGHINRRPVLVNLRIYSMLLDDQVGNPKVKVNTIIPITKQSHIILGGSMYPLELNAPVYPLSGSVRYEKALFGERSKKFWSVGVESCRGNTFASFMITSSW